ncbi:uncharacterized protein L969DRAFT_239199 [Mixia osmundae IAM 14324]|uniref:Uncharacterized protein n=1 Tax=Mixia osmundae (strain CBS 9802 / IAM 14324 / JCM 22182 / KY 12970) TaxID=764103 RepID=G7E2N7_MIXOS|nr:uncharacterized protein L969DRAFT_239199 [Mixia osmundae IAM 14324]KEI36962.1 hypothetical protein L969DRAFT_239199 [Mixia osmundae IAM 14324]GAA97097.1 hypothetical protein E5Q_03772 [Mixia osmundae IAM 14324]
MSFEFTCQRCRQPLRLNDSLADLAPSSYDMLASTLVSREPARVSPQAAVSRDKLARLPSAVQAAYGVHVLPGKGTSYPEARTPRLSSPAATTDSFVVLADSNVAPESPAAQVHARQVATPAALARPRPERSESSAQDAASHRLRASQRLFHLLSASGDADHPLCNECADGLVESMKVRLAEAAAERDRYAAYEKALQSQGAETSPEATASLETRINQLALDEIREKEHLCELERDVEMLESQLSALDADEARLAREEESFWQEHNTYLLGLQRREAELRSLRTQFEHDAQELVKLQATNVYNDAFCIGHDSGIATINGLRLGRLPNVPIDWPEINAAWGHTLLLLHTIARKLDFTFDTYRLVPMGSVSRIERLMGDKASMELYGSGELFGRVFQNRRFDFAMVAFLDCLRQVIDHCTSADPSFKLPHAIHKDKAGQVSIKLQFSSDETWTRALRHVLLDLKILIARVFA